MKRQLTLICFILLASISLFSQKVNLKGRILENKNQPISNAFVKILNDDSSGVIQYFALTDKEGFFSIKGIDSSRNLWLRVSCVGYSDFDKSLNKILKIDSAIIIQLERSATTLPEVYVKTHPSIIKRGDTTSYTVSAFEKGNENTVGDLLNKLPGIRIDEQGRAFFNGKRITRILLEDDDLFGSNYATLTNNTGTSGLDKIEVIENYKDNSRIENMNEKGDETVLNLKYKKKSLRLFGNARVGGGIPLNFYELKANNTGVIGKNKFLVTGNKNTTGYLANRLMGLTNDLQLFFNENEKLPLNIEQNSLPVQLSDIRPLNITESRIFSNQSGLFTINHLLKFSKKINLKSSFNFLQDDYSQQNSLIQSINNPSLPIVLRQANRTGKHNLLSNINTELSWQPAASFQTIIHYTGNWLNLNQQRKGQFFLQEIQQNGQVESRQSLINIIATKAFKNNSYISFQITQNCFNARQDYTILNPLYDNFYGLNRSYKNLSQRYDLSTYASAVSVKYSFKKGTVSYIFHINMSKESNELTNSSYLFDREDSLAKMSSNFYADNSMSVEKIAATFSMSKLFSKKVSVSLNGQVLDAKVLFYNGYSFAEMSKRNFFFLPFANLHYKINNKQHIIFSVQAQPVLPAITQLNQKYVFTGISSLIKGIEVIGFNKGYNFSGSYLFFDVFKTGIIFNTTIIAGNSPPNYLNNLTGQGLLQLNDLVVFDKQNKFFVFVSRVERNFSSLKGTGIISATFNNNKFYTFINNRLTKNNSFSYQFETRFKTNWQKIFNINTGLVIQRNAQNTSIGTTKIGSFKSLDMLSNTTISIKLSDILIIDLQNDYIISKPFNQVVRGLNFFDIQSKYILSKRYTIGLLLRNIFNQDNFTVNQITATQNVVDNYTILPFMALGSIQYKF